MNEVKLDIISRNKVRKTLTINFPGSISEMSPEDIMEVCKISANEFDENLFKIMLVKHFCSLPDQDFALLYDHQIFALVDILKFEFFDFTSSKSLVPYLDHNSIRYYAPHEYFTNTTLMQFGLAEQCFWRFQDWNDPNQINLLIDVLYMPAGTKIFDENDIDESGNRFRELPDYQKQAVLLSYCAMRRAIFDLFKNAFELKKPAAEEFDEAGNAKPAPKQKYNYKLWYNLAMDLAGPKFGDIEKTEKSKIFKVLQYLEKLSEEEVKNAA